MTKGAGRIALYSHDALGLGHVRRNLAIARTLADAEPRTTLLVTGAREAAFFPMPVGTDCLALPALRKSKQGRYRPRFLSLPLAEVVQIRKETILGALRSFEPDVFIVDKRPWGIQRELEPVLEFLRERGTLLVLGLRDVLDAPAQVIRELQAGDEGAISEYYDAIWVYGDPRVYDLISECSLCDTVAQKIHYSGYLVRRHANGETSDAHTKAARSLHLDDGPFSLCLLGGGEDGYRLAEAFALTELPRGMRGLILAGPFMPPADRRRLIRAADARDDLQVLDFVEDPGPLIEAASSVVAMGGYNTICELLSWGKRALIVPRVTPRSEQLIRAERMNRLGLLELIHPERLSPGGLGAWLADQREQPVIAEDHLDMNGLARLPLLLKELLASPRPSREASYVNA